MKKRLCSTGNLPEGSKKAPRTTFLSISHCTDAPIYAIINFYLLNLVKCMLIYFGKVR